MSRPETMTDEDQRIYLRSSPSCQWAKPAWETAAQRSAWVDAHLCATIERRKADHRLELRLLRVTGRAGGRL